MTLTGSEVRALFSYDTESGALLWRERPSPRSKRKAGDVAGNRNPSGRWRINFAGKTYLRSRLVWLYHHGSWPDGEVDHRNLIRHDDRIENLRDATRSEQLANRSTLRNNTSGHRAIYFDARKGRWAARLSVGGIRKRLGTYATADEAAAVADAAGREAFGEFWRP